MNIVKVRIENGIVTQAFLLDENKVPEHLKDWITAPIEVGDGWQYDGTTFTPPTDEYLWNKLFPIRQNMTLSFAQLLIGLVSEGWITEQEGNYWSDGILPDKINAMIASLPPEHQFAARMRAKRPAEVVRTDPLVVSLGYVENKSVDELDQFFVKYSAV